MTKTIQLSFANRKPSLDGRVPPCNILGPSSLSRSDIILHRLGPDSRPFHALAFRGCQTATRDRRAAPRARALHSTYPVGHCKPGVCRCLFLRRHRRHTCTNATSTYTSTCISPSQPGFPDSDEHDGSWSYAAVTTLKGAPIPFIISIHSLHHCSSGQALQCPQSDDRSIRSRAGRHTCTASVAQYGGERRAGCDIGAVSGCHHAAQHGALLINRLT